MNQLKNVFEHYKTQKPFQNDSKKVPVNFVRSQSRDMRTEI